MFTREARLRLPRLYQILLISTSICHLLTDIPVVPYPWTAFVIFTVKGISAKSNLPIFIFFENEIMV